MAEKKYCLKRLSAGGDPQVYPVKEGLMLLGSSPESEIAIEHASVPEIAAKMERKPDGFCLTALARGGFKLNGKRTKASIITPGDRIELGDVALLFDVLPDTAQHPEAMAEAILHSFARFAESVGRERDLRALLSKIVTSLLELLGGTDAFIFKLDGDGNPQVFVSSDERSSQHEQFSNTIVQQVLKSGTGIFVPNVLEHPSFGVSQSAVGMQLSSALCCPIVVTGRTIGIIYVGSRKSTHMYSEKDLPVLNIYALMAGMLISHVEVIGQQQKAIDRLAGHSAYEGVVGESDALKHALHAVASLENSDIPALIEGETGTGKDVVANLIHKRSRRGDKALVVVNCSSLRGELLESELFGHKRGSFTGAVKDHDGLFAAADSGTIFLDEIGEMDLALQAKLLRTLETGKIRPVGSSTERNVDVRVICATNRNLAEMVAEGRFRQDLFYRINQFRIPLPPLRERGEDCMLLAYYFLEKYKAEYPTKDIVDFHPDSIKAMNGYEWPGNVRELANTVHKAVLSAVSPLVEVDLPLMKQGGSISFEDATREFQKKFLSRTLKACGGNKEETARVLGLSRSTMFRYLSALGISGSNGRSAAVDAL